MSTDKHTVIKLKYRKGKRWSEVLGSDGQRKEPYLNTVIEQRSQATPQFAKSVSRVGGFAGKQADASFIFW